MNYSDVYNYNWDNGLECIWPIIEDPNTEYAMLLLIYWRLNGPYLNCDSGCKSTAEAVRANSQVRTRLLIGEYVNGDNVFVPEISKIELYKLKKQGIPNILLGITKSDG